MSESKPVPLIFVVLDTPAEWLGLNLTDKAVLQSLIGHLNAKRNGTEVWPSIERLVKLTGGSAQTVRRSLHRLAAENLIKIRSDSGKSNTYTVEVDVIRALADPCQNGRGKQADPYQNGRGTPTKLITDPSQIGTRTAKRTAKLNNQVDTISCSSTLKVTGDPKQRQLAVHGIVGGLADEKRIDHGEQPKIEKSEQPVLPAKAAD